ncbi:hypothetical protein WJX84_003496 [Apatococcus fuscideae]|uniref:Uncharacterized protein n=1 Tax=Apatococcus fuscideae TaxID=2026836 RepID=A0AAW1SUS5_9CHLO
MLGASLRELPDLAGAECKHLRECKDLALIPASKTRRQGREPACTCFRVKEAALASAQATENLVAATNSRDEDFPEMRRQLGHLLHKCELARREPQVPTRDQATDNDPLTTIAQPATP